MTDELLTSSLCRHPKCDVCGADAKADATPRTEVTDMKWTGCVRVWPDKPNVQSHEVFDLVDKSKLDAEVAAHELTAHELKCAEAERDEARVRLLDAKRERNILAVECEGLEAENKRVVQDRNDAQAWSRVYQADAKKYAAERDAAVAQMTNRDCQIIALRAERDRRGGRGV